MLDPSAAAQQPFAIRLIEWQARHGRHHLPWQNTRDPYRVWLSEIMLQQTQVTSVMGYYARFLDRFPSVAALAQARQDDVLGLWSGLGYYSRARNLHRCAQVVCEQHQGQFPSTAQDLARLPGIGPSTAAAIASLCFDERVSILDGNVQRVVSRYLCFEGDLSLSAHQRSLQALAHDLLPPPDRAEDMPVYTQALMDLGATVCTPRQPQCPACPLHADCAGRLRHRVEELPCKTKKLKRSAHTYWVLIACTSAGEVLLEKRPQSGIWAGLFALPMFESLEDLLSAVPETHRLEAEHWSAFVHVLTHKDLHLHPVLVRRWDSKESGEHVGFYSAVQWREMGLPAPVRKLLEELTSRDVTSPGGA